MRGELSWIQRQKNASSLDILCNRKGTTVITLPLVGCKVSRDVVFDEMSCWYGPSNVTEDADVGNGNAAVNVEQQSQSLSGPSESSANGSNTWTRRLRSSGFLLMAV